MGDVLESAPGLCSWSHVLCGSRPLGARRGSQAPHRFCFLSARRTSRTAGRRCHSQGPSTRKAAAHAQQYVARQPGFCWQPPPSALQRHRRPGVACCPFSDPRCTDTAPNPSILRAADAAPRQPRRAMHARLHVLCTAVHRSAPGCCGVGGTVRSWEMGAVMGWRAGQGDCKQRCMSGDCCPAVRYRRFTSQTAVAGWRSRAICHARAHQAAAPAATSVPRGRRQQRCRHAAPQTPA